MATQGVKKIRSLAESFSHVFYGIPDHSFEYRDAYVRQSLYVKAGSRTGFVTSKLLQLIFIIENSGHNVNGDVAFPLGKSR